MLYYWQQEKCLQNISLRTRYIYALRAYRQCHLRVIDIMTERWISGWLAWPSIISLRPLLRLYGQRMRRTLFSGGGRINWMPRVNLSDHCLLSQQLHQLGLNSYTGWRNTALLSTVELSWLLHSGVAIIPGGRTALYFLLRCMWGFRTIYYWSYQH